MDRDRRIWRSLLRHTWVNVCIKQHMGLFEALTAGSADHAQNIYDGSRTRTSTTADGVSVTFSLESGAQSISQSGLAIIYDGLLEQYDIAVSELTQESGLLAPDSEIYKRMMQNLLAGIIKNYTVNWMGLVK